MTGSCPFLSLPLVPAVLYHKTEANPVQSLNESMGMEPDRGREREKDQRTRKIKYQFACCVCWKDVLLSLGLFVCVCVSQGKLKWM